MNIRFLVYIVILFLTFVVSPVDIHAGIIDDLRQKIDGRGIEIKNLEQEIAQYEKDIASLGGQAKTLATSIKELDIARKKLDVNIRLTESKISAQNLKIEKLELEINDKKVKIGLNSSAIGEILRTMDQTESKNLVEVILSTNNFSKFWDDIENLERLSGLIREQLKELEQLKAARESDKKSTEEEKEVLMGLKKELADEKRVVENNKKEKDRLLVSTKNKESNYKKILQEKQKLKDAFEAELREFESELKVAIDPNSFPPVGSQVLSWPTDNVRVTQYFGDTAFAKSGAYNGKGHNGIDIGVTYGTKIKASLSGTIAGTGDTDIICPGASYGRWVLIKHKNGLSTLYAHLSVISVSAGQEVDTSGIIGYSGDTGYSTGPHLHLTVYATQGVSIESRKSKVCGGTYIIPIAPLNAYLDPINYLKKL
ncbi:MAG: peptidoglycan DD-metalloendopeptidase family protein [bacterium]|nr:peptidoglycan DD-metalloendopeptidase family protein [bacterium]